MNTTMAHPTTHQEISASTSRVPELRRRFSHFAIMRDSASSVAHNNSPQQPHLEFPISLWIETEQTLRAKHHVNKSKSHHAAAACKPMIKRVVYRRIKRRASDSDVPMRNASWDDYDTDTNAVKNNQQMMSSLSASLSLPTTLTTAEAARATSARRYLNGNSATRAISAGKDMLKRCTFATSCATTNISMNTAASGRVFGRRRSSLE